MLGLLIAAVPIIISPCEINELQPQKSYMIYRVIASIALHGKNHHIKMITLSHKNCYLLSF